MEMVRATACTQLAHVPSMMAKHVGASCPPTSGSVTIGQCFRTGKPTLLNSLQALDHACHWSTCTRGYTLSRFRRRHPVTYFRGAHHWHWVYRIQSALEADGHHSREMSIKRSITVSQSDCSTVVRCGIAFIFERSIVV